MARPTKFTQANIDRLLEGVRAGLPLNLAAEAAGISYDTFNEWQHGRFPRGGDKQLKAGFSDALTRAKGESALALMQLIQKAAPDDWRAAAWILERRFPESYGKQRIEMSGPDGGPMQIEVVAFQAVILQALERHPVARIEVANALMEAEAARRGGH